MDALIVDAIQHIKARKKRASMDLILYKLKKENCETRIEDFKQNFDKLESNGVILNKKPNSEHGSYVICDDKLIAEKYQDNDVIKVLKGEIDFLKDEIREKNQTIKKLLALNEAEKSKAAGEREIEQGDNVNTDINMLLHHDGNYKQKDAEKLVNQLSLIRKANHEKFLETKHTEQVKEELKEEKMELLKEEIRSDRKLQNGALIKKDEICERKTSSSSSVVTERRLMKKKSNGVYENSNAHHYYTNEPKTVILHTQDRNLLDCNRIPEQLLQLKSHIEKNIPHATVILPPH